MTCEIRKTLPQAEIDAMLPIDKIKYEEKRREYRERCEESYRNMAIQAFDVRFQVNLHDLEQLSTVATDINLLIAEALRRTQAEEVFDGIDIKKEAENGNHSTLHYNALTLRALGIDQQENRKRENTTIF